MTAIAWFNGGVRIFDIREPYTPAQVAFYVPEANANTPNGAYMTNNVEIDNRGYIYMVDRNGAGMDIREEGRRRFLSIPRPSSKGHLPPSACSFDR